MMLEYELYKVKREIQMHGAIYTFERTKLDEYGEDTKETEVVKMLQALFHTVKGYITKNVSDGTVTHSKGQPKLMCRMEDVANIMNGDFVEIRGDRYKVVEKNDIQKLGIVCDISLEVVLNGNN